MPDVNDLLVRIDATTEQLRKEMRRAERTVDAGSKKIDSRLERINNAFRKVGETASKAKVLLGAAVAVLSVRRVVTFTRAQLDAADAIGKAGDVAGVTAEQIQELRFAIGQLAGASTRDVDLSLQRFNRRLGLARDGSREYARVLEDLGVSLRLDTSQALELTLKRLADIEDGADRASRASRLFGEEAGPRISAALKSGIGAVDDLRRSLHAEGGVISNDVIDRAESLNDEMDKISRIIDAKMAASIVDNADAIEDLAQAMGTLTSFAIDLAAAMARLGSTIGERLSAAINDFDLTKLKAEIGDVKFVREALEAEQGKLRGLQTAGPPGRTETPGNRRRRELRIEQSEQRIAELEALLQRAESIDASREQRRDGGTSSTPGGGPGTDLAGEDAITAARQKHAQLIIEQQQARREQMDKEFRDLEQSLNTQEEIIAESHRRRLAIIRENTQAGSDEQAKLIERLKERTQEQLEDLKTATDGMSVFAEQAARNMQDAFADFLFDPFDDGLKGLLRGWIDTLRRMAAEAAAAKIFESIGEGFSGSDSGLLSSIGKAFGGARAEGGPVQPGRSFLVGERGPELFVPPSTGQIVPMSRSGAGTVNVTNNIDARGAPPLTQAQLRQMQESTKASTINEVRRLMKRSQL